MNDQLLERIAVALEALAECRQQPKSALADRVMALKVERNGEKCLTRNGEAISENQINGAIASLTLSSATHKKYGNLNLLRLKMQGIDGRTYLLEMGADCAAARCLTAGISQLTQLDDITIEAFGGNDKESKSVLINLYQKDEPVRSSCKDWTTEIRNKAIAVVKRLSSERAPAEIPPSNLATLRATNPAGNRATAGSQSASIPTPITRTTKKPTTEIELIASVNQWVKTLGWNAEDWLEWMRSHYNTVLLADLSPEQLNQIRATLWKTYQRSLPQESATAQNGVAAGRSMESTFLSLVPEEKH